jgi:hypothetical protein
MTTHDGACSQNKLIVGLNRDLSSSVPAIISFLPVPSLSIRIGEPQLVQKRRCMGSLLWPPGIVNVDIVPVIEMPSDGTIRPDTNAVPVCF